MIRSRGTTSASIRINKPDEPSKLIKGDTLGALSRWDVEKILAAGRTQSFSQGQHIFEEGSFGGTLFVVKKGAVELLRKDPATGLLRAVGYAKEGDPIGELSLFTGQRLAVTARVPEFAELHVLSTADFKRVLSQHPELCLRICGVLATALARARAAMDDVSKAGSSLGGSLGSFDLATVLNNIVESGESSGVLMVSNRK
ncbi:MAG TPA: cyclic nucleotide-binding domain-containing protein, partial [Planctomycetota bacterium]|nr:cyclic nucleotide-binding domain-containing protein [Planctomycetota bacterium]